MTEIPRETMNDTRDTDGYPILTAAVVHEWTRALRSGKYKQGQGMLRTLHSPQDNKLPVEYRYCCLGVLADILAPDGWGLDGSHKTHGNMAYNGYITPSLMELHIQKRFSNMNDTGQKSFDIIADAIDVVMDIVGVKGLQGTRSNP